MKVGEELEKDIPCTIDVSVEFDTTLGALEHLVATELLVNVTTGATSLGCVGFIDDDDLALAILSGLVDDSSLEPVVGPA